MSDLLTEAIMHAAEVRRGDFFPVLFAHVVTYDPTQHAVQVMIPAYTGGEGTPTMSGWIPLMSPMVGNGFGVQFCLHGGATYSNPTGGELVVLFVMDDSTGAFMAAMPFFTPAPFMPPPGTTQTLKSGELLIKHESGSNVYMKSTGDVVVAGSTNSATTITIANNGEVTVNVGGSNNVNITGSGQPLLQLGAGGDALALVSALVTAFNSHTHLGVTTGSGVSGIPQTAWTASTIKSTKAATDG